MSHHDDRFRLAHILDHAREAVEMCRNRQRSDAESDRQFGLALTRLLEIIGEAASKVSVETRQSMPNLPWTEMTGLRNRLVHGYDDVDYDVLWDTIQLDLPPMIRDLETSVRRGTSDSGAAQ